ncbi:MAG TPA: PAS domain S-box protein, partial [Thermodesulfobacteriota bacterium]|nr:PAS domain S-box protein [Thermodesulfobacteriota bacterium]
MIRNLSILGVAAVIAMCLAWILGSLIFIRPINRLVTAAQRFGKGDMTTRTGLPHTPDGLGRLAQSFDDMASLLEKRNSERDRAEKRQALVNKVLEALNGSDKVTGLLPRIPLLLKDHTGIEAVGIRLRAGEDFPHFAADGFSEHFLESEKFLCARDGHGEVLRDACGKPHLECLCGTVVSGRTDPSLHFFTEAGSFWTNNASNLVASVRREDLKRSTRGGCMNAGYESVALIPLRSGEEIVGLLQLNDKLPDRFELGSIEFLEGVAASIGIALARKEAEEKVSASEQKYRNIFERAFEGIFQTTPEGKVLSVNQSLAHMLGFASPEDAVANITDLASRLYVNPGDRARFKEVLEEQGFVERHETQMYRKDGTIIWISLNARVVRDANGKVLNYEGMAEDITERRAAEQLLKSIFSSSPTAIFLIQEGRFQLANAQAALVTGYREEELVGMDAARIIPPPDRDTVRGNLEKLSHGVNVPARELRWVSKDGRLGWAMVVTTIIEYHGSPAVLVNSMDITERKLLEAQLLQAQKLESIGQLAAGIAHEINTPTQYVGDNIHFLDGAFADMIALAEKYKELLDAAKAGEVTKGIINKVEE